MTEAQPKHPNPARLFLTLMLALLLAACGGGGTEGGQEVVATLSWTPPTENTDNTPLEDLAGFRLYIGDSPSRLQPVADIPAGQTRFEITSGDVFSASNLFGSGSGGVTVYFALTAYNSLHIESSLSEIVSKVF
jgi:hypothetical protein